MRNCCKVMQGKKLKILLSIAMMLALLSGCGSLRSDGATAVMPREAGETNSQAENTVLKTPHFVVADILIGDDYYIALCDDGSVWSWGDNESKKLGINTNIIEVPQKIDIPEHVIKIEDGGLNIWALTDTGHIYVWGRAYLREGKQMASLQDIVIPVKLENIPLIEDISVENNRAAVLDCNGELYLYGVIHWPQEIPAGTTEIILEQLPEEYRELTTEVRDMDIGAGRNHYFIREDGTVFSIMSRSAYEEGGYGFIFPNENENQSDITYYWPDEINNIEILNENDNPYFYVIYYECENLTGADRISADDYTMFLYKKEGTLWYWMSDRVKYQNYTGLSSHADDGLEYGQGQFESIDIAEIMDIQEDKPVPRIIDMCSNVENTLFLTSDGELFISSYVTDHTEDVEYYVKFNEDPGRLPTVEVLNDVPIKCIKFKQLDYHNIISINGDGQYNFSAIDSMGNYYHITASKE